MQLTALSPSDCCCHQIVTAAEMECHVPYRVVSGPAEGDYVLKFARFAPGGPCVVNLSTGGGWEQLSLLNGMKFHRAHPGTVITITV